MPTPTQRAPQAGPTSNSGVGRPSKKSCAHESSKDDTGYGGRGMHRACGSIDRLTSETTKRGLAAVGTAHASRPTARRAAHCRNLPSSTAAAGR